MIQEEDIFHTDFFLTQATKDLQETHTTIDLHGCSVKQTKALLAQKLTALKNNNVTQLYIITGWGKHSTPEKGRGVLKKILPRLLRPYQLDVAAIHEEKGAYKIILSKSMQSVEQRIKKYSHGMLQVPQGTARKKHLKNLKERAAKKDKESLLMLGYIYAGAMFDDPQYFQIEKSIAYLEQACALDSPEACVFLGQLYMDGLKVAPDYRKAFGYYQKAALKGNALGQFYTAKCLLSGEGVHRDDVQGVEWLTKAADAGLTEAEYTLGNSYYFGAFTPQNEKLASFYCERAAKKGYIAAQVHMARCYGEGQGGVKQDRLKAFEYYLQAAEANNIYAIYQIGWYLTRGELGYVQAEKGFAWFMRGALLDDEDCQSEVALAFYSGKGVSVNIPAAIEWATKATEKKSVSAYMVLIMIYSDEKHGMADPEKVKTYTRLLESRAKTLEEKEQQLNPVEESFSDQATQLLQAAKAGDICAQVSVLRNPSILLISPQEIAALKKAFWSQPEEVILRLTTKVQFQVIDIYRADDELTLEKKAKILRLLEKLAAQDCPAALLRLGAAYQHGTIVAKDVQKTKFYWQKGAELGSNANLYNLGYFYEQGMEGAPDYVKAMQYYSQAAKKEDAGSHSQLGIFYSAGKGVAQDFEKAMFHMLEAIRLDGRKEKRKQKEQGIGRIPILRYAAYNLANLLWKPMLQTTDKIQRDLLMQPIIYWFLIAEEAGNQEAINVLNQLKVQRPKDSLLAEFENEQVQKFLKEKLFPLLKKYGIKEDSPANCEKALRNAVSNHQLEDVKILLIHVENINAKDTNPDIGRTALHWAFIKKDLACIQLLLEAGADLHVKDNKNKTPLDSVDATVSLSKESAQIFKECLTAAEKGNKQSQFVVAIFYYLGLGIVRDYASAFKYWKMAADRNHPEAIYFVGLCYHQGRGTSKNIPQAKKYYELAAEQEHPIAKAELKHLDSAAAVVTTTVSCLSGERFFQPQSLRATENQRNNSLHTPTRPAREIYIPPHLRKKNK